MTIKQLYEVVLLRRRSSGQELKEDLAFERANAEARVARLEEEAKQFQRTLAEERARSEAEQSELDKCHRALSLQRAASSARVQEAEELREALTKEQRRADDHFKAIGVLHDALAAKNEELGQLSRRDELHAQAPEPSNKASGAFPSNGYPVSSVPRTSARLPSAASSADTPHGEPAAVSAVSARLAAAGFPSGSLPPPPQPPQQQQQRSASGGSRPGSRGSSSSGQRRESPREVLRSECSELRSRLQEETQTAAELRRSLAEARASLEHNRRSSREEAAVCANLRLREELLLAELREERAQHTFDAAFARACSWHDARSASSAEASHADAHPGTGATLLFPDGNENSTEASSNRRSLADFSAAVPTLTSAQLEQLAGGFRRILGAGDFGRVFAGRAAAGEAGGALGGFCGAVAVKVPSSRSSCKESKFLRQVAAAAVHSEHLVPLLAVCVERRALVYPRASMTLAERLQAEENRIEPAEGLQFLVSASRGLLALHQRGLAHCDVHSENVLLFPLPDRPSELVAQLGDFSLSQELPAETEDAAEVPPGARAVSSSGSSEQVRWRRTFFLSSDVFALGIVMLEVLLRRRIAKAASAGASPVPLWQQLQEVAPGRFPDSGLAADFARCNGASDDGWRSRALHSAAKLCAWALSVEDSWRPSAAEVVEVLEAALAYQEPGAEGDSDDAQEMEEEEERVCVICFEAGITARLRPCFHAMTCADCAAGLLERDRAECPICRCQVTGFDRGEFDSTFAPPELAH